MMKKGDVIDQQVEDLRERMRLLQSDRRANVDMLEGNKTANSEEIRSHREENKKLRLRLTQLQKQLSSDNGNQHELHLLQRESLQLRKEFDCLKVISNKSNKKYSKLKDEAKTCELEAKIPNHEGGPFARKIRMLENRLDKAMIKYNEAQSIKKTYEQIVKRLKEEGLSFNNQLRALERTLKAKKRDNDELLLLSGDANHAREVAQHELHQSRRVYEDKRTRRGGKLRETQQFVKIRGQLIEKQEKRVAKRKEAENLKANESAGDDSFSLFDDEEVTREQERKLDLCEKAFRKIKETTGVSDVNEVIEKVTGQEKRAENLISLTKENDSKIKELNDELESVKKIVDDLRLRGQDGSSTRKMVDDEEEKLASSLYRMERCKSRLDRLSSIVITAKSGVKNLQEKLENIGKELNVEKIVFDESDPVSSVWSAGTILVELVARTRERDMSELLEEKNSENDEIRSLEENNNSETICRPFNQRVSLPSAKDGTLFDEFDDDDDNFGDIDDEELSRDRVKKASSQIIRAQKRKKAKEKNQ